VSSRAHQHRHNRLGQRCTAVEIQMPGAIRRHAARHRHLREVAANADLVSAHHQAVTIAVPLPSIMRSCAVTGQLPWGLTHTSPASAWALRKKPWSVTITASLKPMPRNLCSATRISLSVPGISPSVVSGLLSSWLSISVERSTSRSTVSANLRLAAHEVVQRHFFEAVTERLRITSIRWATLPTARQPASAPSRRSQAPGSGCPAHRGGDSPFPPA
jgi:hypothetical protein